VLLIGFLAAHDGAGMGFRQLLLIVLASVVGASSSLVVADCS